MKRIITLTGISTGIALLAITSAFAAVASTSTSSNVTSTAIEEIRAPDDGPGDAGMHIKRWFAPGVKHLDKVGEVLTTAENRTKYVEILKAQRDSAKAAIEALKAKHESAHIALENKALAEFAASGTVSDATESELKALNETIGTEIRTAMESQKTSLETALKSAFGDEVAAKLLPSKGDFKEKVRGKIKDRMKERRGGDRNDRGERAAPTAPTTAE